VPPAQQASFTPPQEALHVALPPSRTHVPPLVHVPPVHEVALPQKTLQQGAPAVPHGTHSPW
jgi:hypothetical protein